MSEEPIAHGGGVTAAASRYGGRAADWLDLSTGINPCPPALPAIEMAAWHRLPDSDLVAAARAAAGRFYGCGTCLPLPVPGTQSVIQLLPGVIPAARRVAVLSPTYGEYARVFANAGFEVDRIGSLDGIGPQHGLAVVVNPNNPDGQVHCREDLLALAARLHGGGGLLVVDEAFADAEPQQTLAAEAGRVPGLVVFRSFGKFFGLAGLRLGFVLAEAALLDRFADRLGPWAVSGPALSVAASLFARGRDGIAVRIRERKQALDDVLAQQGLAIAGGSALFSLVRHDDAHGLQEALCRRHILVRRFDYDRTWLRFGLAPDERGDARLAAALSEIGGSGR
ncbi:threonine-phosphate decarboxylase CobD [Rhizobium sp. TRM95111]|uniref:threonine-phosphate decarboxylase CobD n=1 Tax=Rhizobium alarense TaxID=2846851 RepID=UPI001F00885F|nr:threonine-phosphate decarboxylase CobD [Rhizobium alarense]MCF3640872.1 threonine-phosphate decarboxylase CobD [Rhizobium alarense]